MNDHEYGVVHPNVRARLAYDTEDGSLSALRVRIEYDRRGEWDEPTGGLELKGHRVHLTRDGESLFERDVSAGVVSDLLERYGVSAARTARRLTERLRSERADPESWPIAVTQADGTVVEAIRPPAQATFEVYEDEAGEWRWRLVHRNGNVIADGGEGYSSKQAAKKGIRSVKRNALGAPVEES